MTDPFTDVADELMTRSSDLGGTEGAPPPAAPNPGAKTKKHVCPYCGAVTAVFEKPTGPCPRCSMEDTPAARAATKSRIGPWYVLQTRNPSAPGMKWATLLSLVAKGQVTPRSVVRGPTTHQLWKFAAHVKGLSREFNLCYSCGAEIDRAANQCGQCDRLQEPPINPDALLESREPARLPVQREIKPAVEPTELAVAGDAARTRSPDDGILSAKELAAAFQLDFNPQAPPDETPARAPRQRRPARTLFMLMLLAGAGGAALLYARPDYRARTSTWLHDKYAWARTSLDSSSKPQPKPMPWESQPAPAPEPAPTPAAAEISPSPAPTPPAEPEVNIGKPAPAPDTHAPDTHAPTPDANAEKLTAHTNEAPPNVEALAPAPSPEPVPAPAPAPAPAAKHSDPPPAPVSSALQAQQRVEQLEAALTAQIPDDADAQTTLYKQLWDGALDAELKQDFDLSIRCYKRLKQFPVRNDGVIKTRLEYAQRQLSGK